MLYNFIGTIRKQKTFGYVIFINISVYLMSCQEDKSHKNLAFWHNELQTQDYTEKEQWKESENSLSTKWLVNERYKDTWKSPRSWWVEALHGAPPPMGYLPLLLVILSSISRGDIRTCITYTKVAAVILNVSVNIWF